MSGTYSRIYDVPAIAYVSEEDTSFVSGDSPVVYDVNSDLNRKNGTNGYFTCDGAGDIKIQISSDGINYGSEIRVKNGEVLKLRALDISKLKVVWVADSSYRLLVF